MNFLYQVFRIKKNYILQSLGKLVTMGMQNSLSESADTSTFNLAERSHLQVPGSDRLKLLTDYSAAEIEFWPLILISNFVHVLVERKI